MKKLVAILAIWSYGLILPTGVFSADNVNIDIIMLVQDVAIINSAEPTLSATAGASKSVLTNPQRSNFKNTGNLDEDFGVRVTSPSGDWALFTYVSTNPVPVNHYRLFGVWAIFNAAPDLGLIPEYFDDNDIITNQTQWSSDTKFWSDVAPSSVTAGGSNQAFHGGDAVPQNGEKCLFFRFDSGAPGTSGGNHTVQVNVSARVSQ